MDFIIADIKGNEVALLKERQYIDIDIGNTNDFEMEMSFSLYKSLGVKEGFRLCVPGKEYGGIIDRIKTSTNGKTVTLSGDTWRGLMAKKVIVPPDRQAYRTASGDANTIINSIICSTYGGIFKAEGASGIVLNNYKFDRYIDALGGIEKMLRTKNARIDIQYNSGEPNSSGYVVLKAVSIHDYSNELEYSRDGSLSFLSFEMEKYTGGINHLICLGKDELTNRIVVHLYVQGDGSITQTPYYTGPDERAATYDYSNAETSDVLVEEGIKRLKELMSYTNTDMTLHNSAMQGFRGNAEDIAIGDIVGARDYATDMYTYKPITEKIIRVDNGQESIEFKVGGNALNRSSATAPDTPENSIFDEIYPVGSIYMSINNVNPSTLFGGQWSAWGSGRVPVGVDANNASFNSGGKTGGEAVHTLTAAEMPSHSHTFTGSAVNTGNNSKTPTATFTGSAVSSGEASAKHSHSFSATTNTNGAHTHGYLLTMQDGGPITGRWLPDGSSVKNSGFQDGSRYMQSTGNHNHTISGTTGGFSSNHAHSVTAKGTVSLTNTAHTHSVTASGTIGAAGSGGTHNNLQPYITCYMWLRTA